MNTEHEAAERRQRRLPALLSQKFETLSRIA